MRYLVIICAVFAFVASPAVAGIPSHPGQQHRVLLSARVCTGPVTLVGVRMPQHKNVYVDAYVNHHRLLAVTTGSTIYMVGVSTLVQTPMSSRITARIVRTVPGCALVEVVFTWR